MIQCIKFCGAALSVSDKLEIMSVLSADCLNGDAFNLFFQLGQVAIEIWKNLLQPLYCYDQTNNK